ncbi:ABC transporter ATP-binding protein [Paenibacillus sp. N1-5-1-14]|uniref:ABC transporter ATP-binding protein n=1 Tax=Paenibacillus radicibacter TaxID=2972488 RepID=UPI0021598D11|nr:ABC transporter ATP-binding protein [Paenibacillus radicibacter]MCR8645132.1 ABC transporter ATP-binding protein [Paenibacillus radicibacter]
MNNNKWVIETKGLSKQYKGHQVVSDLNLQIAKGEIYGFLGPNGAGKTTTIRMLLGLIKPTTGNIEIFGKSLEKERMSILRKIGSLVEYPSNYAHLNAIDNLEAIRHIIDVPKSRIDEVLAIVGLTKDAKRAVRGYSLGMKQRLGIASALLGNPELLILDEPTNGLDPAGILEIRELIKEMPKKHGITVVVSSHLLSEVEQMASMIGIIQQGKLVYQDTIRNMQRQSQAVMKLRVSDPIAARQVLVQQEMPITLVNDSNVLELGSTDEDIVAGAVRSLILAGHEVYRVEEERQSLEQLFLDIVEEGKGNAS